MDEPRIRYIPPCSAPVSVPGITRLDRWMNGESTAILPPDRAADQLFRPWMKTRDNSTLDEVAGPPKRRDTPTRKIVRRILFALGQIGVSFIVLSVIVTLPLRWIHPVTTSFILQDRAASSADMRRMWTPFEEMSRHLPIAVVAAEDQMFPFHNGFDLESISKAMNEDRDRPRGASTISMQLAKNLYLWPGRSMLRKGLEAWFTVLIELFWPKERILEVYLNVVEFGNGIYGAESASQYHFGKSVSQIGPYESALLAAVLPSPGRMSAGNPSAYVYRRAAQITSEVRRLGGSGYLVSGQPPVRR